MTSCVMPDMAFRLHPIKTAHGCNRGRRMVDKKKPRRGGRGSSSMLQREGLEHRKSLIDYGAGAAGVVWVPSAAGAAAGAASAGAAVIGAAAGAAVSAGAMAAGAEVSAGAEVIGVVVAAGSAGAVIAGVLLTSTLVDGPEFAENTK